MTRERRIWLLLAAATVAAVIVVVAIVISQSGGDDEAAPARIEQIPQDGLFLGDPDAPATLIEFADLQCPFCADFTVETLPGVIDSYVRDGRLRLELRLLAFIGPDSVRGRQWANAAALQDKLWDFTEAFYRNQEDENSGYVTNAFLERIARRAGVDIEQLAGDLASPEVRALSREANQLARQLQLEGTPAFYLARDGGQPEPVQIEDLGDALDGG